MKKIILSKSVEKPKELYDVVVSNVEFINSGHRVGLINKDFNYDSLCSYFIDYADELISFDGFKGFLFKSRNKQSIKNYISEGLEKLDLKEHKRVFDTYLKMIEQYDEIDIYDLEGNVDLDFHKLDDEYRILDSKKLEDTNANFLLNHPDTVFMNRVERQAYLDEYITQLGEEEYNERTTMLMNTQPRYVRDISFLCDFLKVDLEDIYSANLNRFQYESHLHVYFKTKDGNKYCYIDLGYEIVLMNDKDEEIRRFSREKNKKLMGC